MSQRRHHALQALLAAVPLCLVALPVCADTATRGPSEVIFLFQIIVLLVCGRLMGELMQRIGQPAVMGQLIAGILLGPSALGALWFALQHTQFPTSPDQKAMIDVVAQLGILLLLLLTGMPVLGRSADGALAIVRAPATGELYRHHLDRLAWMDELVAHHGVYRVLCAADLLSL